VDAGCELTLIPKDLVRSLTNLEIRPSICRVWAANNTSIRLDGGRCEWITALASEDVNKVMLGVDWLETFGCVWNFATGKLYVDGQPVTTLTIGQMAERLISGNLSQASAGEVTSMDGGQDRRLNDRVRVGVSGPGNSGSALGNGQDDVWVGATGFVTCNVSVVGRSNVIAEVGDVETDDSGGTKSSKVATTMKSGQWMWSTGPAPISLLVTL